MNEDRNQTPDLSFIIKTPGLRSHEIAGFAAASLEISDPYNLTTIHPGSPPTERVYWDWDVPADAYVNHQWETQVAPAITVVEVDHATFKVVPGPEVELRLAKKMQEDLSSLIG